VLNVAKFNQFLRIEERLGLAGQICRTLRVQPLSGVQGAHAHAGGLSEFQARPALSNGPQQAAMLLENDPLNCPPTSVLLVLKLKFCMKMFAV
jgi:hypothetical protein